MAKERYGEMGGKDAAYIKPKFIPDDDLLPRDNSGGIDFEPYTAIWGDGGYVTGEGEKGHLTTKGGEERDHDETGLGNMTRDRKRGERGERAAGRPRIAE